jgi:serine/threonine protein kinase
MLINIDHVHIVNIYEYYLYTKDIFIVMEYLNGGELFDKIMSEKHNLTENSIRKMMREILSAVAYLHSKEIGNSYLNLI